MQRLDLTLHKGRTFTEALQLVDEAGTAIDITGATVEAEIRAFDGTPAFAFTTALTNAAEGTFTISASAVQTDTLDATTYFNDPGPATYIYDIVITYAGGEVETLVQGEITVLLGVTA